MNWHEWLNEQHERRKKRRDGQLTRKGGVGRKPRPLPELELPDGTIDDAQVNADVARFKARDGAESN